MAKEINISKKKQKQRDIQCAGSFCRKKKKWYLVAAEKFHHLADEEGDHLVFTQTGISLIPGKKMLVKY